MGVDQDGEVGDAGEGSVDRRRVGGLRKQSNSGALTLRLGRGEGRNSSIRSVSGTGSMVMGVAVDAFLKPDLLLP